MSEKKAAASAKKATTAKATKAKAAPAVELETGVAGKRKASLHQNFREITVVMTNGTTFKTRSTYGNDTLKLDIDVSTHPAWTNESNFVNLKADKVTAFSNKYQGLNFLKSAK